MELCKQLIFYVTTEFIACSVVETTRSLDFFWTCFTNKGYKLQAFLSAALIIVANFSALTSSNPSAF